MSHLVARNHALQKHGRLPNFLLGPMKTASHTADKYRTERGASASYPNKELDWCTDAGALTAVIRATLITSSLVDLASTGGGSPRDHHISSIHALAFRTSGGTPRRQRRRPPTEAFPYPKDTTRRVRWFRASHTAYASICCPAACSPYCCRTSPHTAYLLHDDCVYTLQRTSRSRISMHDLWDFVRCIQPAYAGVEAVAPGTRHQRRILTASISSAILTTMPSTNATLLQMIQTLLTELQSMILDFTGQCLGLSLVTVLLDTLPLLEMTPLSTRHPTQIDLFPIAIRLKRRDLAVFPFYLLTLSPHSS
jgi:hypothetical protein